MSDSVGVADGVDPKKLEEAEREAREELARAIHAAAIRAGELLGPIRDGMLDLDERRRSSKRESQKTEPDPKTAGEAARKAREWIPEEWGGAEERAEQGERNSEEDEDLARKKVRKAFGGGDRQFGKHEDQRLLREILSKAVGGGREELSEAAIVKGEEGAAARKAAEALCAWEPKGEEGKADLEALGGLIANRPVSIKASSLEAAERLLKKRREERSARGRALLRAAGRAAGRAAEAGWEELAGEWRLMRDWERRKPEEFLRAASEPSCSWEALMRRQAAWHLSELERAESAAKGGWYPVIGNRVESADGEFLAVELSSAEALHEEGQAMRHCVGTYAGRCAEGESAVFSVLRRGLDGVHRRSSTLELSKTREGWRVEQQRGKCNEMAGDGDREFALAVAKAAMEKELERKREKEAKESETKPKEGEAATQSQGEGRMERKARR